MSISPVPFTESGVSGIFFQPIFVCPLSVAFWCKKKKKTNRITLNHTTWAWTKLTSG